MQTGMDVWVKRGVSFVGHYREELALLFLLVLIILMIILLKTVRKNNQNMKAWSNGIKKMIKVMEIQRTEELKAQTQAIEGSKNFPGEEEIPNQKKRIKQQEEELFGRILQEYFP